MGYVNADVTGWTELRVHGVSATAPESMLQHPHACRVAGYEQAGFYRRVWEAEPVSADTAERRLEAYSWGGLTSGDNKRALWLLLLPFMLLNVAFFMAPWRRPPAPAQEIAADRRLDRFSASVQRLFALSFTGTLVLAVVSVAMDLVGWQCGAGLGGDRVCAGGASWLSWLGWGWLDRPGRQLAVTALLPVLVIVLLWWLARATWANLERVEVKQLDGAHPRLETPLEDRAMWNGRAAVRRLRSLHIAAGLAVTGVFVVAPLLPDPARGFGAIFDGAAWDSVAAAIGTVVLLLLLVVLAGVAVVTGWPGTGRRERPKGGQDGEKQQAAQARRERWTGDGYRALPWVVLGLTVAGGLAAWIAPAAQDRPSGGLPWLVGVVHGLFVAQVVLVLLLLVACVLLRRRAARPDREASAVGATVDGAPEGDLEVRPAWRGFAMVGIAVLGWLIAGGFSAGLVLRVAQILGTPVVSGQPTTAPVPLVVPTAFFWVAVAGLAVGVIALVLTGITWLRLNRPSADMLDRVRRSYPDTDTDPDRRTAVARPWTQAQGLGREAQQAFGIFLLLTAAVVLAGVAGFLTIGTGLVTGASFLVAIANLALSGFVLALLWVGRQAYRNPTTRRTVGIAWDLGTFWPRAVHPLAPPCYAERAIPDLMQRLDLYASQPDGKALLSCHSQGSVLGAAVLLQIETPLSARTSFLSYGSPLARLYGRFFPAYFSPAAFARLGGFLTAGPRPDDRTGWRWRNLYRLSDPIGGAVLHEYDGKFEPRSRAQADGDNNDVDRQLVDPAFERALGDPCYPTARGHSGYFADPAFSWTADALRDGILPGRPRPETTPAPTMADTIVIPDITRHQPEQPARPPVAQDPTVPGNLPD